MPETAVPLTFAGGPRRLAGVPMSLKSAAGLSATFSGTGNFAAAVARAPYLIRRPLAAWITSPRSARQDAGSTFHFLAAADTSMVLAVAPAWRGGCHGARAAVGLPGACPPASQG